MTVLLHRLSLNRIDLIFFFSDSGKFQVEFWFVQVGQGYIRFFKRKCKVLFQRKHLHFNKNDRQIHFSCQVIEIILAICYYRPFNNCIKLWHAFFLLLRISIFLVLVWINYFVLLDSVFEVTLNKIFGIVSVEKNTFWALMWALAKRQICACFVIQITKLFSRS